MREPRQITASQTMMTITNSMIGVSILALPRIATELVNTGAILVTIISLVFAFISICIITILGVRFPKASFIQYSKIIIGRPIAYLFGFMIFCLFIMLIALITREFSEMLNSFLYPDTPQMVLIGVLLFVVAITTRNDMTTISYIQFFYFPFLVLPVFLMIILAFQELDFRYVQPFIGNANTFKDFLKGGVVIAALPFIQIGIFITTVLIPHTQDSKHAVRGSLLGMLLSGTIVSVLVFVTLGVFGVHETKNPFWPLYVLTRMVQLPVELLGRLDILFLGVWILSAFTTILSGYLIIIYTGSQLFHLRSHRVLSYIMLPFVFAAAIFPKDILHLYELINKIGIYGLTLTMVYPLVLLFLSVLRQKKGGINYEET